MRFADGDDAGFIVENDEIAFGCAACKQKGNQQQKKNELFHLWLAEPKPARNFLVKPVFTFYASTWQPCPCFAAGEGWCMLVNYLRTYFSKESVFDEGKISP